ncbi:MAG: DNA-processing protein DprA, partial [Xanthomonadales bacterium]|nr:DNA-processing protein DprA [Xanthomonadales bacterium]
MPDVPAAATDAPALLRLAASGLRAGLQRRLLDSHGTAAAALAAGPRDWASHGVPAETVRDLRNPDPEALRRGERWLAAANHHLLGWRDPDYPPLLRRIASPPALLFVAGDPALLWRPALAIVGSRAATAGGRENAASFARTLAASGLCLFFAVVSDSVLTIIWHGKWEAAVLPTQIFCIFFP